MISFRLTTILNKVQTNLTRVVIYDNGVAGALAPLAEAIQHHIQNTSYLSDYDFNFYQSLFSEQLITGMTDSFISEKIGLKLATKIKSELTVVLLSSNHQLTLVMVLFDHLKQVQIPWPNKKQITSGWLVNKASEQLCDFLTPLIKAK